MKSTYVVLMASLLAGLMAPAAAGQTSPEPLTPRLQLRLVGAVAEGGAAPFERLGGIAESTVRIIDGHTFAQAHLDVFLSDAFSITPALVWYRRGEASSHVRCGIVPPCGPQTVDNDFDVLLPELQLRHHRPRARSDLFIGGGVGYGVGWLSRQHEWRSEEDGTLMYSQSGQWRTNGASLSVFAGFAHDVVGPIGLFVEGGYRYFQTGPFRATASDAEAMDDALRFDLTGPFGAAGLSVDLRSR